MPGVVSGGIELGAGGVCRRFGLVVFLYGYGVDGDQFAQAQFIRQGAFVLGPGRLDCRPGGLGGKSQVGRIKPHQRLSAFDVVSGFHQFLDYFAGHAKTKIALRTRVNHPGKFSVTSCCGDDRKGANQAGSD